MNATPNAFDFATDTDEEVNQMLAATDGKIAMMEYSGTIGYHINVATGESDPEYLWKIALLQAMDETLLEMVYVDADDVSGAREQLERQLAGDLGRGDGAWLFDRFEEKLGELVEVQQESDSAPNRSDSSGGAE